LPTRDIFEAPCQEKLKEGVNLFKMLKNDGSCMYIVRLGGREVQLGSMLLDEGMRQQDFKPYNFGNINLTCIYFLKVFSPSFHYICAGKQLDSEKLLITFELQTTYITHSKQNNAIRQYYETMQSKS
jgi:hypothetical protein